MTRLAEQWPDQVTFAVDLNQGTRSAVTTLDQVAWDAMTVDDLIEDFLSWSARSKRPGTISNYRHVQAGLERSGGVLTMQAGACRAGWAQQVHDKITVESGPSAADSAAKLLSAAWTHALRRGAKIPPNPLAAVRRHGTKPPRVRFGRGWLGQAMDSFRDAAKDGAIWAQAADFFTVLACTGARAWCEALPLRWDEINEREGVIDFPHSKEEARSIPIELLGDRGWAAIERQRGLSDRWVWPGRTAEVKRGDTTMYREWRRWLEYAEAGGFCVRDLDGKRLTPHSLRHAFISECITVRLMPPNVVGQLVGHVDTRSTDRYTHWSAEHLRGPAREIAAARGGPRMGAAAKTLGIDGARLDKAILELGGRRKAEADEAVAARVGVTARAVTSWRSGARVPPHRVIHTLARWIAEETGWSPALAIGWLYGEGQDDLPPRRGLQVVR